MTTFTINGQAVNVAAEPDTPLLWVVREHLKLTGTKFGCGIAQCGACTVHVDGEPTRSCQTQLQDVAGKTRNNDRRPVAERRSSTAESLDRRAGPAMRLLPVRPDHAGGGAPQRQSRNPRANRSSSTWTATSAAAGPMCELSAPSERAAREA